MRSVTKSRNCTGSCLYGNFVLRFQATIKAQTFSKLQYKIRATSNIFIFSHL